MDLRVYIELTLSGYFMFLNKLFCAYLCGTYPDIYYFLRIRKALKWLWFLIKPAIISFKLKKICFFGY